MHRPDKQIDATRHGIMMGGDVASTANQPACSRGRGRPAKITPATIVNAAIELLGVRPVDAVTLASVAGHLNVPTTSIYNYFANRDALLSAVATRLFANFEFADPDPNGPWRKTLLAWLHEIDRFFERYPIAFHVMATNGQVAFAWVKASAPLIAVLRRLGFEGRQLALVHAWFEGQVAGMLFVEGCAGANRLQPSVPVDDMDQMGEDQKDDLLRRTYLTSITRQEIVDMGFAVLLDGLERLARENATQLYATEQNH